MLRKKLRPVLNGHWWMIGPSPDLEGKIDGTAAHRVEFEKGRASEHNAPVDHHIVRDGDGIYHLWGCVRATAVGRIFYHWEAGDVKQSPWRDTGEIIRADRAGGESIDDWWGEEWIQSPYFIKVDGTYYMFYGGHRAGIDASGERVPAHSPARGAGFTVRTSKDFIHWSDWRLIHRDPQCGSRRGDAECPFVLEKAGYFYLFRTIDYWKALTLVFRSDDPYDFGIGDASSKLVGRLPCAAPELYTIDGQEYVSSSHAPQFGEQMCRLEWVDDG